MPHASCPRSPKRCKEAIDKGLELFQAKQYQQAVDMFNLALELPGNGAYRLAGSPREFRWEEMWAAGHAKGSSPPELAGAAVQWVCCSCHENWYGIAVLPKAGSLSHDVGGLLERQADLVLGIRTSA